VLEIFSSRSAVGPPQGDSSPLLLLVRSVLRVHPRAIRGCLPCSNPKPIISRPTAGRQPILNRNQWRLFSAISAYCRLLSPFTDFSLPTRRADVSAPLRYLSWLAKKAQNRGPIAPNMIKIFFPMEVHSPNGEGPPSSLRSLCRPIFNSASLRLGVSALLSGFASSQIKVRACPPSNHFKVNQSKSNQKTV
jgi:hypothetical protein